MGAIVANIVVPNNQIVWYAAAEGGTPLALDAVLSAGTYYAAQSAGSCESETRTSVVIQISEFIAPEAPLEQAFCGDVQVKDLAATGSGVVWFDSEGSTTPLALDTPLETATYYAAQSVGTCYGDRLAVQVTVSPSCGVVVALKVFLQGPTPTRGVAEMTNYIQEPDPVRSRFEEPKLPIVNPYGIEGSYADINNPEGAAQKVVDWVLVEIWGDVDVSSDMGTRTVLERQALLLQPDGTIVDATGQSPKFEPQDGPVRIIIKHRNHLSVMSAEIAEFTGEVEWDFTTGLDKAHQYNVGNSTPMVLKNGVYCMWAGDLNVDGIINASDVTILDFDFVNSSLFNGEYALSDLNMDGGIDSTDATLIDTNFVEGARSPVSYFR